MLGLSRAYEGAEAVFHCAAFVSMWRGDEERMWKANAGGTEAVLEAVRRASVRRLVHVSTIDAIGISEDGPPADETTPWNCDRLGIESGYARSKRAAEERVLEAARGQMPFYPSGIKNFADVRDAARGMLLAFDKGRRASATSSAGRTSPSETRSRSSPRRPGCRHRGSRCRSVPPRSRGELAILPLASSDGTSASPPP